MTLLGIDPGKTIGWSLWTETGFEIARGTFAYEDIRSRLHVDEYGDHCLWFSYTSIIDGVKVVQYSDVRRMAIENYRGRPGQKNGGQQFWGPEALAKCELLGELAGIEVRRQEPSILKVSALHAGYTLPKGHLPDQDSAYLHARYRLEELGVLRAKPLDS